MSTRHHVIVAFVIILLNVFLMNSTLGMDLVRDGQAKAKIVIAADACRMVAYAAEELQSYIEKISGAKLLIEKVPASGGASLNKTENYIFAGESIYTEKLKIKISELKTDGFKIVAKENWLALVGRDYKGKPKASPICRMFNLNESYDNETGISAFGEEGTLSSVYRFLEDLGVRWFMPGELGEVIPKQATIEVKDMDYKKAPDFTHRRLYFAYGFDEEQYKDMVKWYRRVGFGSDSPVEIIHSFQLFKEKYFKTHPEWFYNRGTNAFPHLVLTEPAVLEQFVQDIREYFDANPGAQIYPVMPDDMNLDRDMEKEPRMKGMDDPSMGKEGRFSDYVWTFVNKVAKEIAKTHPDKIIACCAYSDYLTPPKTIKRLNSNVAVMIAKSRVNYTDPEYKNQINAFIKEWKNKCNIIYLWEYYNFYRESTTFLAGPIFSPHIIAEDLKFLKGMGVKGEFIEAETMMPPEKTAWPGMTHLNYYVTAKYLWDADQDIETLLSDYYEKFYGPAREEMKKFYARAEKTRTEREKDTPVEELLGYLKAAKEKAGDSVYGKRVDLMLSEASRMIKKGVKSKLPCVPLPSEAENEEGLAGYWKFDEGEGKIAKDSSGNENHGVVHNAEWLKGPSGGSSLGFNGKDSCVEIRYPKEELRPERKLTVMGWFYYNEIGKGKNIGLIWTYNYAYLLRTGNGLVQFGAYGPTRSYGGTRFQEANLIVPGWNHIAGVYDVDGKKCKIYLNGEEQASYPYTASIDYAGDNKPWKYFKEFRITIGACNRETQWQESFDGRIDEVKIYNRALSDDEIRAEYKKGEEAFAKSKE